MKLHSIAIMGLVLLSASGCTERLSTDDGGDGGGQGSSGGGIEVLSSVEDMTYEDGRAYSRALTTNDMALTGVRFLRVDNTNPNLAGGVIDFSSTAMITANRAATSGKITFTSPTSLQYDKQTNYTAYLAACHPAPQSVTGGVATWAAAQMNDIIISGNYSAGKYTSDIRPVMSFAHKLCRVEVVVRAAAGTDIGKVRGSWGKITGISLADYYASYNYNYSNQGFSGSGSAVLGFKSAGDYSSSMAAADVQAAGGTVVNGAVLMMPQSSTTLTLTVTGEKRTEKITVTMGGPLVAGKVHKVLVDVKGGSMPPMPFHSCIKVGNLWWTTGNLVTLAPNRCIIGAPTDGGLYFQFGSLIGWNGGANGNGTGVPANDKPTTPALGIAVKPVGYTGATGWGWETGGAGYFKDRVTSGVVTNLVTDNPATGIGDACRYYLGGTWRLPTEEEYVALWGTPPETNGPWQDTPPGRTIKGLFFPASGYRDVSNGPFDFVGRNGYRWSGSVYSATNGFYLRFTTTGVSPQYYSSRAFGFPVRCVSEP